MKHHTLTLACAWEHQSSTEVAGFAVEHDSERPEATRGRASLNFDCGCFSLHLRATPAELRALAALLQATAEDQERANVPPYGGPRAVWPNGLTHLPQAAA